MRAELDGGVGHDPRHGGRVPPPQAEQPVLHVGAVDEPEGLLVGGGARLNNLTWISIRPKCTRSECMDACAGT